MNVNGFGNRSQAEKERLVSKPMYEINTEKLYSIIEGLKSEQRWIEGELNSVILFNSSSIKVLLTILHEGSEVISYQANDSITFKIIEGSLALHLKEELIVLGKGEMITIDEKIRYSFDAVEDTAFLLTLVSD